MRLQDAPVYLTTEQLQAEIKRYTYRPGWRMQVFHDPYEGPCLYVVAEVPDGYNTNTTVQLRIRSTIPPQRTSQQFGEWLLWRLLQIESHECREFFRRDGLIVVDPHDPIEPDPSNIGDGHEPGR